MKEMKILLIDDDPFILQELKGLLELCNYPVIPFTDPCEALNQFDHIESDIIFVDYVMPGMDGLSFIKAVKGKKPDIISILCTGALINHRLVSAMINTVNIHGFLTKPCRLKDIVRVLESSLQKARLYRNVKPRKFPRSKSTLPVCFFTNSKESGHEMKVQIETIDISEGGLRFSCSNEKWFNFAEDFEVDLSHLNIDRLNARAEIVWIAKASKNTFHGGVKFL